MTHPIEAYYQGVQARKDNPLATTWDHILPYAVRELTEAWLDGWYDAVGKYRWGRKGPVSINTLGGYCPFCWHTGMVNLPDGILRCRNYPCCERNYPPVDHVKANVFLAQRDAGGYI